MKSSIIKQLIANYIHQKNSNKNFIIKKLPTQTNHHTKKKINRDIKNPSIKARRKPRFLNANKNYFEPNKRKLKSVSRYKDHQNHKYKNMPKYPRPNMNRTIYNDAYGNIITNVQDRNLSAPSLNYETNMNYKKYKNKKKKNNIIQLYKVDKRTFNDNLINKDNYAHHMGLDNNYIKDNKNLDRNNNNLLTSVTYNKESHTNNNLVDFNKSEEYDSFIKVKTLEKEDNIYTNANNLNINNFYKNRNNNKKHNENNSNSKNEISNFIDQIEAIKNKRETIALLKEQLKRKDNIYKVSNKQKLNKIENNNIYENKNTYKNNNTVNLVNKSGYVTSNFHNYNKYFLNKSNKNYINKTNNNTYYNDTSSISKDLSPNKNIPIITRGHINLSNSSNNKTNSNSTNITNNNNNLMKKIDSTNVYEGKNEKEENDFKENNLQKEKKEKVINKNGEENINPNNNFNNINQFYTEKNLDTNNNKPSDSINNEEDLRDKNNEINNKISNKSDILDKRDKIIDNSKKSNYTYLQKPKKKINNKRKETSPFSLNEKNKNNKNINNKITRKKGINNKKKYISKNNYITNKIKELNSRFKTINT